MRLFGFFLASLEVFDPGIDKDDHLILCIEEFRVIHHVLGTIRDEAVVDLLDLEDYNIRHFLENLLSESQMGGWL